MKVTLKRFVRSRSLFVYGGALLIAGSVLAFEDKPVDSTGTSKAANIPIDEGQVKRPAGPYTSFAPIIKKLLPRL